MKRSGKLSLLCACAALLFAAPLAAAETHTNSIGMEFVKIPAGSFLRGTPKPDCDPNFDKDCWITDEMPQRRISISGFWLGKYEVTQEQWVAIMGKNPSLGDSRGRTNPVDHVGWEEAQEFIKRLNEKEGRKRYRLPTEAEWEYAARAGSTTEYFFGDDPKQLGDYAWYSDNAKRKTHPVGELQPNAWGLYDMYGNVAEWVQDLYAGDYYASSPEKDPKGPDAPKKQSSFDWPKHVLRGGHAGDRAQECRSGARSASSTGIPVCVTICSIGFRLAMEE